MKILIVDDDCSLLEQLKAALEKQDYAVETTEDGNRALEVLFEEPFDLVVLDIMMPELDGLSLLREIRKADSSIPVLMLSARGDTEDRVRGLDLGADDYLPKPFSLNELGARIRALLRRKGVQGDQVLRVRGLELDTARREVLRDGARIDLTPKEFAILEFLLYNKNRAVSRFNLAEHVWQDDFDPFDMSNFMDVHIKNLRRKIEGDQAQERLIQTVRGVGYIVKDEGF